MLRKTYNALLKLAAGPRAEPALAVVSFAEASFFPIPPDVMLGPMAYAKPAKWLRFALVCTIASVLGALAGYAIGLFLIESVGQWLINLYGGEDDLRQVQATYDRWGLLAVIIAGFTPVPFKIFTIASGMLHYNLPLFILGAVISRGARFFLVAWLFHKFGPVIAPVIEKRLGLATLLFVVLLVGGILFLKFAH